MFVFIVIWFKEMYALLLGGWLERGRYRVRGGKRPQGSEQPGYYMIVELQLNSEFKVATILQASRLACVYVTQISAMGGTACIDD
jgi:hypothetical protein